MKRITLAAATAVALLFGSAAQAGPVIIDGTDANDHGSFNGTVNVSGWEYMQRALTNLGGNVDSSVAKVVTVIGTTAGQGQAYNAINSAFAQAGLTGWTINYVNTAASINAMAALSTSTTGILYLTTYGLSAGDMDSAEMAAVNARAAEINSFVAAGGGLFAMGESGTGAFGWLSTLLPTVTFTDVGGGGVSTDITLTGAGASAFPGLSNADLTGADPWHGYFSGNFGGLQVLGVANDAQGVSRNLIIGGGSGTVIQCGLPGQPACPTVPEPGSLPLLALAGLGLVAAGARRRKSA